jgi:hypothetical protein
MPPVGRRRWIVRLTARGVDALADETTWYGGYGGLVRWRTVSDPNEAHRFDNFLDAVTTKEKLLAFGIADDVAVEET